jgi:glycosyltransferase involved in cell wall biosynthesis
MRIFHLVPNMNYGGLQEVVRGLALSQRRAGHSVTIGCWTYGSNHPEVEQEMARAGVPIHYLRRGPNGEQVGGRKYLFYKIKEHLGRNKVDILHVHNPFDYYVYGALAARAAGSTKVINTLHATVMFDYPRRWRKTIFWSAAMLSNRVVAVCDEVQTVIRRKFVLPRRKLAVVENGIDLGRFLAVPPRRRRDEVVFGSVGRMATEKNHRLLIEAFGMLRERHSNIRLRLLGGGKLEPELREFATRLGIADSVEFCGFSNDVPAFLSSLEVFALPSNSEGLPLTLLEAIASGLPVVATAVGGVPRIVEKTDCGWLCAPRDAGGLANAMESAILADRIHKGERARSLVSQYYSADRMGDDYERLYENVLN